ncbi:SIMPL domain-containing protein [Halodurantibacterium flavum]|uniref:SIMPL domain-containing protein n=1 Tax=Halodurantibacterium flavum TaxID=1382802 RepID=A0ABW4S496_9RHOB
MTVFNGTSFKGTVRPVRPGFSAFALGVALGLGALAVQPQGAWAQDVTASALQQGQIRVSGQGRVDAAPDMATITLGVTAEDAEAAVAMADVSTQVAAVLSQLEAAGIEARDMQTSGLVLTPRWNYSDGEEQRITGYIAQNNVTVRVRDLESLGGLLDEVIESGANTLGGLSFGIADPQPLEDEARRNAIVDARRKAEIYAEAAGLSLGDLVAIYEPEAYDPPRPFYRMESAMSAGDVPVAAGEVTIAVNATVVFSLNGAE